MMLLKQNGKSIYYGFIPAHGVYVANIARCPAWVFEMKCTSKKLLFFGLGLGVSLFIINSMFFSNAFIYYASGIWLGDLAMQGKGESGILVGLSVGLLACIVTSIIYCYLACRLLNKPDKQ